MGCFSAWQTTPSERKGLAASDRALIFDRLISLGFPTLAEDWADHTSSAHEMQARLALSQRDGRRALAILDELEKPDLLNLHIEALEMLNAHEDLALLLATSGKDAQALRVKRWMGEWAEIAVQEADTWSRLAQSATREIARPDKPSLARSNSVAEGAATDWENIVSLLEETALN